MLTYLRHGPLTPAPPPVAAPSPLKSAALLKSVELPKPSPAVKTSAPPLFVETQPSSPPLVKTLAQPFQLLSSHSPEFQSAMLTWLTAQMSIKKSRAGAMQALQCSQR